MSQSYIPKILAWTQLGQRAASACAVLIALVVLLGTGAAQHGTRFVLPYLSVALGLWLDVSELSAMLAQPRLEPRTPSVRMFLAEVVALVLFAVGHAVLQTSDVGSPGYGPGPIGAWMVGPARLQGICSDIRVVFISMAFVSLCGGPTPPPGAGLVMGSSVQGRN